MIGPCEAVHDALIRRLRALGTDAGARFFGQIQQKKPDYPYGMVWQGIAVPIDEECFDRTEITSQIDVWANATTYFSVKTIADAIRLDLHEQTLEVDGYIVDRIRIESIRFPDVAPNYRAMISLSIETQPAA
jgi:hypothetical protein